MSRPVLVRSARTLHKLIENMADKTVLSDASSQLQYRVRLSKLQALAALSPSGDTSQIVTKQKPPKRTANLKTASLKPRSTVALLKRTADLKLNDSKLYAEAETKSSNKADSTDIEHQSNGQTSSAENPANGINSSVENPSNGETSSLETQSNGSISSVIVAKTQSGTIETASAVNEAVETEVVSLAKNEVEMQVEDVSTSRSKSVPQLSESGSKQTAPLSKHPSQPKLRNGMSSNSPFTRKPAATTSNNVRQTQPRKALGSASKRGEIGTIEDLAAAIQSGKVTRVIVMCGAGISTASGIPDFRTPGTGLYSNLQKYNLPYPEAIFDIDYFEKNPKPFFTLAKELYPSGKYMPNAVHYFFKLLHDQNRLFRIYTQNIDGLERMAGVPPSMLVEAHGTFATATCTYCGTRYPGDEIREDVFAGRIPHCRDASSCSGVIKPDIVFFGEDLPIKFYTYLRDFLQADALFVLGTSLNVEPFASILNAVRFGVPRVLFNREAVGPFSTRTRPHDFTMLGDLVSTVTTFCDLLGWRPQLDALLNASPSPEEFSKRFFVHDKPKSRTPNGAGNGRTGSRNSSNGNPPSRTFGSFTRSTRLATNVLPAITAASPALGRNRPVSGYTNAKASSSTSNGPVLRRPPVQRGNAHVQPVAINRWIWRQDTRLTYDSEESDETESESTDSDS